MVELTENQLTALGRLRDECSRIMGSYTFRKENPANETFKKNIAKVFSEPRVVLDIDISQIADEKEE